MKKKLTRYEIVEEIFYFVAIAIVTSVSLYVVFQLVVMVYGWVK